MKKVDPALLRQLNAPEPARVEPGPDRMPAVVWVRGMRGEVAAILDEWRIEDDWWRLPVHRRYFRMHMTDGRTLDLFVDLVTRQWFAQRYHAL